MYMDWAYYYAYGAKASRFVPVWQKGYSIGDVVTLLTYTWIAEEFDTNDVTIEGAS